MKMTHQPESERKSSERRRRINDSHSSTSHDYPGADLGYIGLGKMGFNMVERLLETGYQPVVYDPNREVVSDAAARGAVPADTLQTLTEIIHPPRIIWLMTPHPVVDSILAELKPCLSAGDTVIDGGNSPYKESMRRAADLEKNGINFLDAGVSGGPEGARNGACIMVGGRREVFAAHENLFRALSAAKGYGFVGRSGAGHFVKMVHNGIEYGMMQALAEGFAVMKASPFELDLAGIAEILNHGSVIVSRLTDWLENAFEQFGEDLDTISGSVAQTGEGMWTVETARALGVAVPILEEAIRFRSESQKNPGYTGRIISALRNQFGGHAVFEKGKHERQHSVPQRIS